MIETVQNADKLIHEPNYTSVPNIILDYWLSILSPAEFKVLLCICRKTFGWHKNQDRISLKQIQQLTGLSRQGIVKSIKNLVISTLVKKTTSSTKKGENLTNFYSIDVNCVGGCKQLSLYLKTEASRERVGNSADHWVGNSDDLQKKGSSLKKAATKDNAREEESSKNAAACSFENSAKENSQAVDEKNSSVALDPVSEVETTSKAAASSEVEKPAEEPKAQETAASFVCYINQKFPKDVIASVRSWIDASLDYEKDKSLIRAVVAKFNATEVGGVKSVRMWLTDMLRNMSPVKLDDEVQTPAVEKSSKNVAAAFFEKVDKKFGADKLSGAYEAIEKALKSYSHSVVRMIIDDINLKSVEKVNTFGGLLLHLCKENGNKPARDPVDTSQLEKRKLIARGLEKIGSVNGGCYTFDEKKVSHHTGSLTRDYTFTGHNEFWDEKDKFFEKHYPKAYRTHLNALQSNKT